MEGEIEDHKEMDQVVNTILKHLAFLQHHPLKSATKRGNLLFAAMLYVALQPAVAICTNWQQWNFNSRVSAIDNLLLSIGVLCLSIDIYLLSDKVKTLVILTKSDYKIYNITLRTREELSDKKKYSDADNIHSEKEETVEEITLEGRKRTSITKNMNSMDFKTKTFFDKRQQLIKEITSNGGRRARITANVMSYFFISFTLVPLSGIVSYILQLNSLDNLPLLFLIYSPFTFTLTITSFFEYFLLTLVEVFYVYYTAVLVLSGHLLQMIAIFNVIVEMRLFHLNAEEIDKEFENAPNGAQNEASLRLAARELVIHHQTIFRKVEQLNDTSNFRIFYSNSYICLQIVFGIFIFLKGEFIYKIKYALMLITITVTEYIFSENGQKLQDEGEQHLRMALYECNWIDKPTWFTKTLQILMTRNNNLPKIGLLNLFTLNRNNVTVVIRGAYSYFNLLNNISS